MTSTLGSIAVADFVLEFYMRPICRGLMVICFLLVFSFSASPAMSSGVVYLSSLEWPPYVGRNLPGQGESAVVVREAFAAMGYRLKIVFLPWKRAMLMTSKGVHVAGYFPEYYSSERTKKFVFSNSFGCSRVGLIMRKNSKIDWNSVDDLRQYRVGFVSGYVNTRELDEAVANGTLAADFAQNDESNILKTARGRVDCSVVDPKVADYYLEFSRGVSRYSNSLVMHEKTFGDNNLYIAFRNTEEGRRLVRIFNEGLKKIKRAEAHECGQGNETLPQADR